MATEKTCPLASLPLVSDSGLLAALDSVIGDGARGRQVPVLYFTRCPYCKTADGEPKYHYSLWTERQCRAYDAFGPNYVMYPLGNERIIREDFDTFYRIIRAHEWFRAVSGIAIKMPPPEFKNPDYDPPEEVTMAKSKDKQKKPKPAEQQQKPGKPPKDGGRPKNPKK